MPLPPPPRALEIAAFLEQHGWDRAATAPFDGDFSPRRYARLTNSDGMTAILMDADADQKTPEFVTIDRLLRAHDLPAPDIYAENAAQGLVLMQDFGTRNIGALLDAGANPRPFFVAAAELLAHMHAHINRAILAQANLPLFETALFTAQAELFLDAYMPLAKEREASDDARADFRAAWQAVLRPIETTPRSLLLRDLIPDNLMDLGDGKLGLLDFQDAGIGPTTYDLASLCDEVRRDGAFALLPDVIAAYINASQKLGHETPPPDILTRHATILSAQRTTRILGVVANLALKQGRQDKRTFVPRLQAHLRRLLPAPGLIPLREWIEHYDAL